MTLTPSDVRRIARLARLDLPPDALPRLTRELGDVLAWVERIDRVVLADPASEPAPGSSIGGSPVHEADDTLSRTAELASEEALRRAPAHRDGFFLAPES